MPQPPVAKKEPRETEIHGIVLKDDYFWLRNKHSEDVLEYLQAENEYTVQMVRDTEKLQEQLFGEMKSRIREDDESAPIRYGDYYYYYRQVKGKNYRIHCRKRGSLEAQEEVILDENALAEDRKYFNIGSLRISNDHTLLAYTADFSGGETYEAHVVSLLTGEIVDRVENIGARLEWTGDDSALFYTELDDIHRDYTVSCHILRTEQGEDKRIFKEDDTHFVVQMKRSADGRYLFVYSVNSASETVEVRYLDLEEEEPALSMLFSRDIGSEFLVEHHDGLFYFLTDHNTSTTFRLLRTPIDHLKEDAWRPVTERRFETRRPQLVVFRGHLVVLSRSEGLGTMTVHDLSSGEEHDIELPEDIYSISFTLGRFSQVFYFGNPEYNTENLRFYFSSPITPRTSYDYNMAARELQLKKRDEIKGFDPSKYTTKKEHAIAPDGTRIPSPWLIVMTSGQTVVLHCSCTVTAPMAIPRILVSTISD